MFKKIWEWTKKTWNRFDAWVASKAPGIKTKIVAGIGIAASGFATLQEFVDGLPLETWINAKTVTALSTGLFILAFWFRTMVNRD